MPVYTYRCDSCGVQFERQQSFQDAPLKTCPECRKKTVKRIITPTKIIFKGSGFYATDHKSPSGSGSPSSKKEVAHDHEHHDHGHDHHDDSHGDESKPTTEKKKSSKSEASE